MSAQAESAQRALHRRGNRERSVSGRSQFSLLREKRFGPFFVTQFLGAFNDNVYKNALLLLLAFHTADRYAVSSNVLINLSAGLFILPFFLFSATAGQLADKFEKSRLIRLIKLLEVIIMGSAAVALWFDNTAILIFLLFMMGVHSALFGPVKYGLMPQVLADDELLGGNGLVETGTFLAILLGTALGGVLIGVDETGRQLVAVTVLLIAVLGYLSSRAIPLIPAVDPGMRIDWNLLRETIAIIGFARTNRTVFLCVLGISWFWFTGSIYLTQLPNFSLQYLGGNEQVVTLLLTTFSVGVGVGSLLCERLTGHKIDIGLVPFGALGLTLFGIDLAFVPPRESVAVLLDASAWLAATQGVHVLLDVLLLGTFGGFYIVPLYAAVQHRSDTLHRSRIIAANNVLNALLMVGAALLAIATLGSGFAITDLFLLVAVLNGIFAAYLFVREPEFISRFFAWLQNRSR